MALHELDLSDLPAFAAAETARIARMDFRQPLQVCAVLIANASRDCFLKQQDPDGNKWPPLKNPRPRTRGKGQRGRSPAGTTHALWDTGKLVSSVSAGAPGNVNQVGQFELIFGTNLEYARYHQFGATIPARQRTPGRGKPPWRFEIADEVVFSWRLRETEIPARPFLGISESLAERIGQTITQFVAEHLFSS